MDPLIKESCMSIPELIHVAVIQIVGRAGAVIVEGGISAVFIVYVVLQVPVLIVEAAAVDCSIRDVITRGVDDRSHRDMPEGHRRIGRPVVVL